MVPNLFQPVGHGVTALVGGAFTKDLWRIGALVLGAMLFTRFIPSFSWPSRWPMGLLVGAYSGLAVIGFAQGDLIAQLQDALIPVVGPGTVDGLRAAEGFNAGLIGVLAVITNAVLISGLLSTLYYFFFSQEHMGFSGGVAKVGIWFLMISFGASYGFTVMGRVSLALDRLRFLFADWLGFHLL
jgi:hypothetical protein